MAREDHFTNTEADAGRYERFHSSRAYDPRDEWPDEADVRDDPKPPQPEQEDSE